MLSVTIKGFKTQQEVDQVYNSLLNAWGKVDLALTPKDPDDGTISLDLLYGDGYAWDLQAQEVADLVNINVDRISTEYEEDEEDEEDERE